MRGVRRVREVSKLGEEASKFGVFMVGLEILKEYGQLTEIRSIRSQNLNKTSLFSLSQLCRVQKDKCPNFLSLNKEAKVRERACVEYSSEIRAVSRITHLRRSGVLLWTRPLAR